MPPPAAYCSANNANQIAKPVQNDFGGDQNAKLCDLRLTECGVVRPNHRREGVQRYVRHLMLADGRTP